MKKTVEHAKWDCRAVLKKYREGESEPYEVLKMKGNTLQSAGVTLMWALIVGGGGTAYSNANSRLRVYAAATYVNGVLEGASPETISGGKKWKASWTGASGDGAWTKWQIDNGATAMNEKVVAMGTKSGGTWTLEVSITLS